MRRAVYQTLSSQAKYPLDAIGALPAVAYSLRKLSKYYRGAAIRVRRASDNTFKDIGFDRGRFNQAELVAFCAGSDGFIETWYDQIGSKNLVQVSTSQQPQIAFGGGVATGNGLVPTIYWRPTATMVAPPTMGTLAEIDLFFVHKETVRRDNIVFDLTGSTQVRGAAHIPWSDGVYYWDVGDVTSPIPNWRVNSPGPQSLNKLQVVEMNHSAVSNFKSIVVDGVALATGVATIPAVACNQFRLGVSNFEGLLSEVLIYNRLLNLTHRNQLTTNARKYYKI